jgi:alpha-beta hydrolase superfamily lysophospholipase
VFGQLANALADAGYLVLRYDKRGIGQSGGRPETAGLAEYAEDLRAAITFMVDRKAVDPRRLTIVGHSEGGAVALLAAAKDRRAAALVLLAATGVSGNELLLAQQRHLLDRSSLSEDDKQAKIDLQKRIQEAVITGKGWDRLPAAVRGQVDNAEFQSILAHDPARIMPDVRQPILIVQGGLDTQVDPSNADRLASLAGARKRPAPFEVVKIPGVNHLFVPATTGEVEEYPALKEKQISAALASAIVAWLQKTLPAPTR